MEQKLPVFKKFCFFIPLRIGVIVIGYWSIFSKLLQIWFNINNLASMAMETSSNGAGVSKLEARAYMFRTLNIIVLLVYLVLSVMLLVGIRKKKPDYLRHFFVSSLVMTVADIVVTGVAILSLHLYIWMFAVVFLWIATNIYSLLIVRSAFLEMEEKERGPRPCEVEEEVCWDTMQLAHVV